MQPIIQIVPMFPAALLKESIGTTFDFSGREFVSYDRSCSVIGRRPPRGRG
jgi:hypothetical protein